MTLRACLLLRCLIECRDEYKYNVEAVELLIRNHLVNMQQYDLHLAQVRPPPQRPAALLLGRGP